MRGRIQRKSTLESSNYPRFLLLWCGELISAIGGGLTSFGLGVYVFQLTRSAASMALVSLLAFLPSLLLSVPAGVLADRYDRLKLMICGDGLSALGLVYILACMKGGRGKPFPDSFRGDHQLRLFFPFRALLSGSVIGSFAEGGVFQG